MRLIPSLMCTAFCASFALAMVAPPAKAQSQGSGLQSRAESTTEAKTKKKKNQAVVTRRASPYSTNPEYDVYVRGEYVGSDPDPRIRATIRQEATRYYGMR